MMEQIKDRDERLKLIVSYLYHEQILVEGSQNSLE